MADLSKFFRPRSVAVVGASTNPRKIGHVLLKNIVESGFKGKVIPVHPYAKEILGLKVERSLAKLKGKVELAVIVVPAGEVMQVLKDGARAGVKNYLI
ncbi:CoA-binding protein, partial [Candidatus Pacearchaeota archaeon]